MLLSFVILVILTLLAMAIFTKTGSWDTERDCFLAILFLILCYLWVVFIVRLSSEV